MRRMVMAAAAVFALGGASAAVAADGRVYERPTAADIQAVLAANGLPTELGVDNEGDPKLKGKTNGVGYTVLFHNCTKHRNCEVAQFVTGFSLSADEKISASRLNTWNERNLVGRAIVDDVGDPRFDAVFPIKGGLTADGIASMAEYWKLAVGGFVRFIGWEH